MITKKVISKTIFFVFARMSLLESEALQGSRLHLMSYTQNVTRALSIQGGIPRLPQPYLHQWASSTLTLSDKRFCRLSCCSAVDMMLGGKSLFPNLPQRKAGVFSTAKRLRSPTAAVFPWLACRLALCWGTWPESLIDTSLPSAKSARFA